MFTHTTHCQTQRINKSALKDGKVAITRTNCEAKRQSSGAAWSRGGCPGPLIPNSPQGLCGRKATLEEEAERLTKCLVRSRLRPVSFLEYWAALSRVSCVRSLSMIWSSRLIFSRYSRSICFLRAARSFSLNVLSCKKTRNPKSTELGWEIWTKTCYTVIFFWGVSVQSLSHKFLI